MKSPFAIEGINPGEVMTQSQDYAKNAPDVPLIPLDKVSWPEFEEYAIEHHKQTAILASHIARQLKLPKRDVDAVWIAGLLHDTERMKPYGMDDPDHGIRAANRVEKILRTTAYWSDQKLITTACWLIANHSNKEPTDPALQALIDADRMEAARISPGTPKGAEIMKDLINNPRRHFLTEFGHNRNTLRIWMKHRGWK